jgi:[protein-PII] uridylyltransferase
MRPNETGIRDQAERRSGGPPRVADRVRSLRTFVEAEHAHLLERHRYGLGGREIARGRADLVDLVVGRASRAVAEELGPSARDDLTSCAIVALGGYGRQELSPHSDVDVLVLHPGSLTSARQAFVESVLPLLWDVGLEVGHSVRSIADCIELGRTDLHARNAMSEARLVTGDEELFHRFTAEMQAEVYGHAKANRFFMEAMRAEVAARRGRYGSVAGVLEPNIKEGAGGLRDLHVMGWVGLARYGVSHADEMLRAGLLTTPGHRQALRASDVILRVRNEAHFQTGRRSDILALELQPAVAERMGYVDRHFASAAELFMRDLYHRAEELDRVAEGFLLRADFWGAPARKFLLRWNKTILAGPDRRYRIRDGQLLGPSEEEDFGRDANLLLEVFRTAQRHDVSVSPDLRSQVRAKLGLVDRAFRHSPDAADGFMEILRSGRGVGPALRAMHESGFLARYLPEFRRITLMVQHDHYHRYTIDEHTLRVVEGLDRLSVSDDASLSILRSALEAVEDRAVLALAALLHDIGKGRGAGTDHASRGAAIARRVCRRIGITEQKLEDVVFLVQKHLVMSRTSQRRDLTDEALIQGFAETVGTVDRLNMLYALTYADVSGVAPESWNEWKATLLDELYLKTLPRVAGDASGLVPADARATLEDRVLRELSPEFLRSDVDEFLRHLPDRYTRVLPPEIIARHFHLTRELGSRTIVTDWRDSRKGPYTVLSVCARDEPGLLALMAGALTGAGLDILSLDVFTRDDGVALDLFRVCEAMGEEPVQPVGEDLRAQVTEALEATVRGARDPDLAVERQRTRQARRRRGRTAKAPEVRFERPDALGRTVIEVRADDEPGVLYRIASTLATLGLDISFAKVATEKNQALDVFYVEGVDHRPILESKHAEIQAALITALQGAPPAGAKAAS